MVCRLRVEVEAAVEVSSGVSRRSTINSGGSHTAWGSDGHSERVPSNITLLVALANCLLVAEALCRRALRARFRID